DLNARHQHWGDQVNKTVSKKLYEKIIEYDLEIPNEFGMPTYFDSQGSSSIIDLTLHTEELLLFSPKWSVVKQQLNQTDHELIKINLRDLGCKKSMQLMLQFQKKGLDTEDAQLFLAHPIAKGIDKNQIISAAFLDVSKACNSTDPNLLLTKLKDSGISSTFVSFIRSFCEPRRAYISIENDITSKVKLSSYGIPQGGSLSPVLFNIYIRSIFRPSPNNTILFDYADDLTVTVSGNKSRYNVMRLRSFINKIENSLREIKLEIQIEKTHLIHFNRKR
ncbi:unnamed protein product, partial [Didymodactylos carnosus]